MKPRQLGSAPAARGKGDSITSAGAFHVPILSGPTRRTRPSGTPEIHAPSRYRRAVLGFACALALISIHAHAWYNPQTGRWLNRDPLGERAGSGLYLVSRNNPIQAVDILGLEPFEPRWTGQGVRMDRGELWVGPHLWPTDPPEEGYVVSRADVQFVYLTDCNGKDRSVAPPGPHTFLDRFSSGKFSPGYSPGDGDDGLFPIQSGSGNHVGNALYYVLANTGVGVPAFPSCTRGKIRLFWSYSVYADPYLDWPGGFNPTNPGGGGWFGNEIGHKPWMPGGYGHSGSISVQQESHVIEIWWDRCGEKMDDHTFHFTARPEIRPGGNRLGKSDY